MVPRGTLRVPAWEGPTNAPPRVLQTQSGVLVCPLCKRVSEGFCMHFRTLVGQLGARGRAGHAIDARRAMRSCVPCAATRHFGLLISVPSSRPNGVNFGELRSYFDFHMIVEIALK